MDVRSHETTDRERAEAAFTNAILANPADETVRKVFADWLDDHCPERRVQAKYLREIRKHKFVRLVRDEGAWALKPQWAEHRGPKVTVREVYDGFNREFTPGMPSPRLIYWKRRIQRGWKVPKHLKTRGYSGKTGFFGVYVREFLDQISPILRYHK